MPISQKVQSLDYVSNNLLILPAVAILINK